MDINFSHFTIYVQFLISTDQQLHAPFLKCPGTHCLAQGFNLQLQGHQIHKFKLLFCGTIPSGKFGALNLTCLMISVAGCCHVYLHFMRFQILLQLMTERLELNCLTVKVIRKQ